MAITIQQIIETMEDKHLLIKSNAEDLDLLEVDIAHIGALLNEAEFKMDHANSRYGNPEELCIFCGSTQYNSIDGIIHADDCIVKKLRKALEK